MRHILVDKRSREGNNDGLDHSDAYFFGMDLCIVKARNAIKIISVVNSGNIKS
jgi:hypothetical protein